MLQASRDQAGNTPEWTGPGGAVLEGRALSLGGSRAQCQLAVAIWEFGPRVAKFWNFQEKQESRLLYEISHFLNVLT